MSIYLIIIIFCANRFNICFQARSERDLPYCKSSSVCSVLHRRFWGASPLLERFCRCPGRLECPYLWSQDTLKDNQSMQLNNRSQLKVNIIRKLVTLLTQNLNCNGLMWQKNYPFHPLTCKNDNQGMKFENAQDCFGWQFCADIKLLGRCKSNQIALNVTTRHVPPDRLTQAPESVSTAATVACFCPPWPSPRSWKHSSTTSRGFMNGTTELTNSYACAKVSGQGFE